MNPDDEPVFVPDDSDRDPDAEAAMQARAEEEGGADLFDPWFSSPENASTWDGRSLYAEDGDDK